MRYTSGNYREHIDRFIKALEKTSAREAIRRCQKLQEKGQAARDVWATYLAGGIPQDQWTEENLRLARRRIKQSKKRQTSKDEIKEQLRKLTYPLREAEVQAIVRRDIMPHLPRPLPLTTDEVYQDLLNIESHLDDYEKDDGRFDFDGALREFCDYLADETQEVQSAKFDLCEIEGEPPETLPHVLWDGDHALIRVSDLVREQHSILEGSGQKVMIPDRPWVLRAQVSGYFTKDGLNLAHQEAMKVCRATLQLALDLDRLDKRIPDFRRPPHATAGRLLAALPLMQKWIGSYYAPRPSEKSLDWRIRNAIELSTEASHQSSDAIAVPLFCAALEALVGQNQLGLTKALAERIGTLLEPDAATRFYANRFVEDLYKVRSNVIHGNTTETGPRDRAYARLLGAYLLQAIVEWRDFQHRYEGHDNAKAFFEELERLRVKGSGHPTIRSDSPIRQLWAQKSNEIGGAS